MDAVAHAETATPRALMITGFAGLALFGGVALFALADGGAPTGAMVLLACLAAFFLYPLVAGIAMRRNHRIETDGRSLLYIDAWGRREEILRLETAMVFALVREEQSNASFFGGLLGGILGGLLGAAVSKPMRRVGSLVVRPRQGKDQKIDTGFLDVAGTYGVLEAWEAAGAPLTWTTAKQFRKRYRAR